MTSQEYGRAIRQLETEVRSLEAYADALRAAVRKYSESEVSLREQVAAMRGVVQYGMDSLENEGCYAQAEWMDNKLKSIKGLDHDPQDS